MVLDLVVYYLSIVYIYNTFVKYIDKRMILDLVVLFVNYIYIYVPVNIFLYMLYIYIYVLYI